jgi:hypothetical protein
MSEFHERLFPDAKETYKLRNVTNFTILHLSF